MLEIVVTRGADELIAMPLDREVFRLGRAATNDLAIPEPTVSRHQCELAWEDGRLRMVDRSGKGTLVNGKPYDMLDLQPGLAIDFGQLAVSLRERPEDTTPMSTLSGGGTQVLPSTAARQPALILTGEVDGKPLAVPLGDRVIGIGSDPGNDLVLADSFISGFHCRIYPKKGAWFVADLDSTNGTFVNGLQVGEARLQAGVSLRLGNLQLMVQSVEKKPATGFFQGMVSQDPAMQPVFELIRRAAPTDETVLITGESGSGKELVARALHALSQRSGKSLVPLNCSAISKELLESELFGHEKGAFTGALTRRKGLFEEAHQGSLFLDEIGELALDLQAKLLRVLENGEIRPVGSNTPKQVDTRVLAATHRALPERVQSGEFREDLFYRICVIEIALPPLRARPEDIGLLARYFLEQTTRHARPRHFSDEAIARMRQYAFPGNVRELKHMVTRAAILCPDEIIDARHLTFKPPTLADRVAESRIYRKGKTLKEVEMEAIRQALQANDYNQRAAARVLGIARSTLHQKIERYAIPTAPAKAACDS